MTHSSSPYTKKRRVQLLLTQEEVDTLENYGDQFGYGATKTIYFLISKAVEQLHKPNSATDFTPEHVLK